MGFVQSKRSALAAAPSAPQLSFRTIHGYRRAYVRAGEGPPLLLIHGIGDSSQTFAATIPLLARRFTVIAPDLLGHGASDKPRGDYSVAGYANAMRDLLSVLDIDAATVVGHSLGGGVAMQFAYQYPERCDRLVLVSSGGVSRDVHPLLRLATAPGVELTLPLLRLWIVRALGALGLRMLSLFGTDEGQDADDFLRMFDALPDAHARRAFVRTLRAAVDASGQSITMIDRAYLMQGLPTLLMWGTRDSVIPFAHAAEARAAMPWSQLDVFEGAGHFPHHFDPLRFASSVERFVSQTSPRAFDNEAFRALLREGRRTPFGASASEAQRETAQLLTGSAL